VVSCVLFKKLFNKGSAKKDFTARIRYVKVSDIIELLHIVRDRVARRSHALVVAEAVCAALDPVVIESDIDIELLPVTIRTGEQNAIVAYMVNLDKAAEIYSKFMQTLIPPAPLIATLRQSPKQDTSDNKILIASCDIGLIWGEGLEGTARVATKAVEIVMRMWLKDVDKLKEIITSIAQPKQQQQQQQAQA